MHAYDHYAANAVRNPTSRCATCRRPAQIIDLFTLQSTDGPISHAKVRCSGGHSYTTVIN
jgi:hypothetical protein